MHGLDSLFWWTGATIALCACLIAVSAALFGAMWCVKKAFNYWWEQTLTIYRFESLRHYFRIMVANGRKGLLKEVEESRLEAKEQPHDSE